MLRNTISTMLHQEASPNTTYPAWLPSGFNVHSGASTCPLTQTVLIRFAFYNCVAIGAFLFMGQSHVVSYLLKGRKRSVKPWSFWSSIGSLLHQVVGIIATALLIRASGYRANMWQLVQLWALRPRVSWFIGNLSNLKRHWGCGNSGLWREYVFE